jgi:SdpC family antimicrobial peptide
MMRRALSFLGVALFIAFGVGLITSPRASANSPRYTDHQIFEGLAFGHGAVARIVPELRARDASWSLRRQHAAVAIESAISRRNPGFLRSFAQDVQSGDPGRVAAALSRMSRAFAAVSNVASMKCKVSIADGRFANDVAEDTTTAVVTAGGGGIVVDAELDIDLVTAMFIVSPMLDLAQGGFGGEQLDKSVALALRASNT